MTELSTNSRLTLQKIIADASKNGFTGMTIYFIL